MATIPLLVTNRKPGMDHVENEQSDRMDPFDRFLEQFWLHHNEGQLRPLSWYLEQFPGADSKIATEYRELSRQLQFGPDHDKTVLSSQREGNANAEMGSNEELIGNYRIIHELGRGGQGVVYKAQDTQLPRLVAIKVLLNLGQAPEHLMRRFRREAEIASKLNHPGICPLIETGVCKGLPYIVMPFLEGEPLSRRIADRKPDDESFAMDFEDDDGETEATTRRKTTHLHSEKHELEDLLKLFEAIGTALHSAHETGVVHRDIKRGNIFITKGEHPVIVDFGLAHVDDESMPALTQSGDVFGTPAYMPPEQVLGHTHEIDRRSDIWSLGVTIYECLTGMRPFRGATRHALVESIRWENPVSARSLNTIVSSDLNAVLEVAMAKDQDRRYQTAADLVEDLRRVRRYEPILARPPGALVRLQRWVQRRPSTAAGLILAFSFLSLGIIVAWYLKGEAEGAQQRAETNLFEYERLADIRRLEDLERELDQELWPSRPQVQEAMSDWIERADLLFESLPKHETAIEALRQKPRDLDLESRLDRKLHEEALNSARARLQATVELLQSPSPAENGEKSEWQEQMGAAQRLVAELEGLPATHRHWRFLDIKDQWRHDQLKDYLHRARAFFGLSSGNVSQIEVMKSRAVEAEKVQQAMAASGALWQKLSQQLREIPAYRAIANQVAEFPVQYGLLPLGPDPESGLCEFAHLGSGEIPTRDAAGRLQLSETTGIVLVLVPGGSFEMGTNENDARVASPAHEVTLSSFFLSKYELTQGQWLKVMGRNPSRLNPKASYEGETFSLMNPVEMVTWTECRTLLDRVLLDFPTEAQWEYACAAGSEGLFEFGNDLAQLGRYGNIADEASQYRLPYGIPAEPGVRDGHVRSAQVGSFAANPWGFHDMHGNVSEWCRDWSPDYRITPREGDGLRVALSGGFRVLRGGDWSGLAFMARRRARNWDVPGLRADTIGIRPARAIHFP